MPHVPPMSNMPKAHQAANIATALPNLSWLSSAWINAKVIPHKAMPKRNAPKIIRGS